MTAESKIIVEQNHYDGTWEVGWKWEDGEFAGEFTPHLCGLATREEAEAEIPGFDARVEEEIRAMLEEKEAEDREQNKRWPNLGYVRARIKKLRDSGKAEDWYKSFDASQKLDWLLDLDLAEHISWPPPSWKAIKSGRVYGR